MQDADWEIASHGLKWIEHKDMPAEVERAQIQEAIKLHQRLPVKGHMAGIQEDVQRIP